MKYLITGLGNPGNEYADTRHNIGFLVADHFAHTHQCTWHEERYGEMTACTYRGRRLWLLKPHTYMNRSGLAVQHWLHKLRIPPERLLVISDDVQLPFGQLRLKPAGGDGGHNGLKHIIATLGTKAFPRLRIGIGPKKPFTTLSDFVLGSWDEEERKALPNIVKRASTAVEWFVFHGLDHAMKLVNTNKS